MGFYLNPEETGFIDSIESKIYVDKTELIAYTNSVLGTEQKYICISRPRRFGKSMAAKMLASYYCRTCASKELFQNLKIVRNPSFEKHLNKYNVIFLNMQRFLSRSTDIENVLENLQMAVLKELREKYRDCFLPRKPIL